MDPAGGASLDMSTSYVEIGYVENGCGHFIQGEYSLSLQTGNMYFIPSVSPCLQGQSYKKCSYSGQLSAIRFSYSLKEMRMAAPLLPMKWMVEKQQREQFQQLFTSMLASYDRNSATIPTGLMTKLFELLVDPDKAKLQITEASSCSTYSALYAIGNQFMHKLSVTEISRFAAMSPRHFQRTIKALTGRSFMQLLQEIRIRHSCGLLQFTRYSVQQVAQMVGICDMNYFYRLFRGYCGMTPAAFRCIHQPGSRMNIAQSHIDGAGRALIR